MEIVVSPDGVDANEGTADDREQQRQEQPVLIAGQGAAHGERQVVRRPVQHMRRQRVAGQQRPAQHRQPERGHHREAEQPRG
jgi:hypothetical protein